MNCANTVNQTLARRFEAQIGIKDMRVVLGINIDI